MSAATRAHPSFGMTTTGLFSRDACSRAKLGVIDPGRSGRTDLNLTFRGQG